MKWGKTQVSSYDELKVLFTKKKKKHTHTYIKLLIFSKLAVTDNIKVVRALRFFELIESTGKLLN